MAIPACDFDRGCVLSGAYEDVGLPCPEVITTGSQYVCNAGSGNVTAEMNDFYSAMTTSKPLIETPTMRLQKAGLFDVCKPESVDVGYCQVKEGYGLLAQVAVIVMAGVLTYGLTR